MTHKARLEKLEAALLPERAARACLLFNVPDDDVDAAVARWRAANDWPDDGRHPIAVLRIEWVTPNPQQSTDRRQLSVEGGDF